MSFFKKLFRRKKKVSWDQIVFPSMTIPSNIRVNPAFAQYKQWKKDMRQFNRYINGEGITENVSLFLLDHPEAIQNYIDTGVTTKDFIAYTAAERAVNNPGLAQKYINAGLTTPELISLQESAYRGKQEIYNQISQEIIQGFPGTGNISFRDLNPSFVNKTMQECLLDYEDMLEICKLANIARRQSASQANEPAQSATSTPRAPLEYGDVYQQVAQHAAMNDRLDRIENNGWGASTNILDNTNALNNAYSQDYSLYAAQQQYNDMVNAPMYSGFDVVNNVAAKYNNSENKTNNTEDVNAVEKVINHYNSSGGSSTDEPVQSIVSETPEPTLEPSNAALQSTKEDESEPIQPIISQNPVDNTTSELNNWYSQDYSLYSAQQQYNDIVNAPMYSGFDVVMDVADKYNAETKAMEEILKKYEQK